MALVNFTNLDFDQIRTSIRDYLRSNSNFTDYDFEGSNLSTLIDVLAYNTYISSYNANMISNEIFIDGATLRENVVSLARNIGYLPRSRTAAKASISFFVDTTNFIPEPITLTLKKGVVCTSSNTFGSESYSFVLPSDVTVPVVNGIALFEDIQIYEGTFLTTNFIVESENPAPPQRYILDNASIDTSLISVSVKDTQSSTTSRKFAFSNSLLAVTSSSRVFFLQEVEDQRCELIFGDGVFGEKLQPLNYIEVSYIITNGENGNGVSSFIFNGRILDNNNRTITSGISQVTTNISSQGGKEIESIESIKKYAPRFYAAQNRAVTASDYETLIPKIYPETQSVSVFGGEDLDPPQYGKVFITIKPFYGPFVPNSIKDNLKKELRKYAVAGIVPEILDLKYVYVEVDVTAYYDSNLAESSDTVKTSILNNITNYSNSSELNRYGARFKYSKFQKIIDDSHEAVSSNITKVQIRRDLRPALGQVADYEICFGNAFHIKDKTGYNIKSSGFTVEGIQQTVYLGDLPNADLKTGSIFLFSDPNLPNPTIRLRSIGTIYYDKGEILLNATKILSTEKSSNGNSVIEISAVPVSNDVLGKQDLYLQLDINKSTFQMKIDDVSSGGDISASTYDVTSSYNNGTRIRK